MGGEGTRGRGGDTPTLTGHVLAADIGGPGAGPQAECHRRGHFQPVQHDLQKGSGNNPWQPPRGSSSPQTPRPLTMGSSDGFSVAIGSHTRLLSLSPVVTSTVWNSSRAAGPRQIWERRKIKKSPQDPPKIQVLLTPSTPFLRGDFLGVEGIPLPMVGINSVPEGMRRKSLAEPQEKSLRDFLGSNPPSATIPTTGNSSPNCAEKIPPKTPGIWGAEGHNYSPPCLPHSHPHSD